MIKRINIDYVILGEGEITLPRLIANSSQIEPVVWGEPPDLDQLPFEDRGLYTDYVSRKISLFGIAQTYRRLVL